jgi:hypothetical protein
MRRMMSIGLALASVLAISATAAQTASAKTLTLSDFEEGVLPVGFRSFIYGKDNVVVHTSVGDIECVEHLHSQSGLLFSVLKNPGFYATPLEVTGTTGSLNSEESCRTGPTNKWGFAALHLGGGILRLRASGKATFGPVRLFIQTERDEGKAPLECFYKTYWLTGSNNATSSPERLSVTLGHKLRLNTAAANQGACPGRAELSIYLPSTSEGIEEQLTP